MSQPDFKPLFDASKAHTAHQIETAKLQSAPFDYLVVDNILSEDLYTAVKAYWPKEAQFKSLSDLGTVQQGTYLARHAIDLKNDLQRLADDQRAQAFWQACSDFLNGHLAQCLANKFGPALQRIYGEAISQFQLMGRARLTMDSGAYSLGPHTDAVDRILPALIYCPETSAYSEQGTSYYEPKPGHAPQPGNNHYAFEGFNKIGTAEFLPNRLFCFARSDHSWHGVEPIETDGGRRAINYKIIRAD